jgi:tetratricopeptide (TPR) repeat protein
MSKARAAALRAIELDERLPEAHTALALIVQNYDWDWQTSEREFLRAIELNPNYATGHQWYAEHLAWLGRFDEALKESQRAQQLDPLSLIIGTDQGSILYYKRDFDAAIAQLRAVRELDPKFLHSGMIRQVYVEKGMFAEALEEIGQIRRKDGDAPWMWSELAYVYGRTGRIPEAKRELEKLEASNREHPFDPTLLVRAAIGAGENDRAFFWLEKAYEQHSNALTHSK